MPRQPTLYIPHGGGPWPFVNVFGSPEDWRGLRNYLEELYRCATEPLRGVLCVTAHFEASVPTVTTHPSPPMLYDYGGFPPESYRIEWPAPGSPELAARTRSLLTTAGIESAEDPQRGFDHGTFVPLKLADPGAVIPTVQLSLRRGLDPAFHLDLGRALAPLREEGILIIGSGSSYHNLRSMGKAEARIHSLAFDQWLQDSLKLPPPARRSALLAWSSAPSARHAHPREEHLIPLHVVAGAAEADDSPVTFPFQGIVLGAQMLAAQFG
jgi:aromatic ring-opening dioxygenase catalytic subunit (LigB family)